MASGAKEGGVCGGGGPKGGRLGLLDRCTVIAGCLPVRRPQRLLDMLEVVADVVGEESGFGLDRPTPVELVPRLHALEENGNSTSG